MVYRGLLAAILWVGLAVRAFAEPALTIVATTGMIGDMVTHVAGERAHVQTLMGEGVDPHSYRQTRSDVVKLGQADIIVYNGLYLEAQLEPLLKKLARRTTVIAVGDFVEADRLLSHDTYSTKFDPHIWMDTELWIAATNGLAEALATRDPDGAEHYRANAGAYVVRLASLGNYAKATLASVPEQARILVTAHDAFNYFGRAYGFEVVGIQGISTESEAGLSTVEAIVDLVVSRNVAAVFVESSVSERNIKAIIEGAGARGVETSIGGQLFSDAMGAPGTYEGTFIGMLDHNATTIARALGGKAPERGMNKRLGGGT